MEEKFLDELARGIDEEENAGEFPRFTHSYVGCDCAEVLKHLRKSPIRAFNFDSIPIYTGSLANEQTHQFIVAPTPNNGTLIWHTQPLLRAGVMLSQRLSTDVHWISIYEQFTCRAYVRFSSGNVAEEILDPEYYWRQNLLQGGDLVGTGRRKFASLDVFLESIANRYKPFDLIWDFEKWRNVIDANQHDEFLDIGSYRIAELTVGEHSIRLRTFGEWNDHDRTRLTSALDPS